VHLRKYSGTGGRESCFLYKTKAVDQTELIEIRQRRASGDDYFKNSWGDNILSSARSRFVFFLQKVYPACHSRGAPWLAKAT